eukprot:Rhum_TRINITY_DN14681_c5_g1::Rhum_TRINITY_DN14681_c5_g1_i1::g.109737::m.109737
MAYSARSQSLRVGDGVRTGGGDLHLNLADTGLLHGLGGTTRELHRPVRQDLNLPEGGGRPVPDRRGPLLLVRADRLDGRLLRSPLRRQHRAGIGGGRVHRVLHLAGGEVALEESLVLHWDRAHDLNVAADAAGGGLFGEDGPLSVVGLHGGHLRALVGLEGVEAGLGVDGRTRQRVEVHLLLLLLRVRRGLLDVDQLASGQRLVVVLVALLLPAAALVQVRLVLLLVQGGEDVVRVDEQGLAADLAEAERLQQARLHLDAVQRARREEEVAELGQLRVHVVRVAVARDLLVLEHLQAAVEHPRRGGTLRVACQPLLEHRRQQVALGAAEVRHLRVHHLRLVQVVRLRRRAVERRHADVVDVESPDGQGAAKRGDGGVALVEALAVNAEGRALLAAGTVLDLLQALRRDRLALGLRATLGPVGQLVLQVLVLGAHPASDVLPLELQLLLPPVEVQQPRRLHSASLPRRRQDALARRRHGAANLVRRRVRQRHDAVDGDAHLERRLRRHQHVHARSLRLHEARTAGRRRARHLLGGAALQRLLHGVRGGLHVRELVRALLREVVVSAGNHHLRLARHDRLHSDLDGLDGRRARADRRLDRTRRRQQKQVDPRRHDVDERLLQDVLLHRLVQEPLLEDALEGAHATDATTRRVAQLRHVDVLVELVRVRHTRRHERLRRRDQREQRHRVDLLDDVLRQTVLLGVPARRHLSGDGPRELQSLGDVQLGTLLQAGHPHALTLLPHVARVAVLLLERLRLVLAALHGRHVVVDGHLVEERLLLRVVVAVQLRLDETHAGVLQDLLLVVLLDVGVLQLLARLRVRPARVLRLAHVLDVAHHPRHLDAALQRELALGLHLPPRPGVAPRTHLAVAGHDHNLRRVDHALQVSELAVQPLVALRLREGELVVRAHVDVRRRRRVLLADGLRLLAALGGDGSTVLSNLADGGAEVARDGVQVVHHVEAAVQVRPHRVALGQLDDVLVHEGDQVQRHLLRRERAHTELLDALRDQVVGRHEAGATGPTDRRTDDGEVAAPVLRVPLVEQRLEADLRLGVQTVAAEQTVVGRHRQHDLRRARELADLLLALLSGTDQAQHVREHDPVRELRLRADAVDLHALLGDGGERHDEVDVLRQTTVLLVVEHEVDHGLAVRLRAAVERHDVQQGALGAPQLVHAPVEVARALRVRRRRHDHAAASGKEDLHQLHTDRAAAAAGAQRGLAREGDAVVRDVLERLHVHKRLLRVVLELHRVGGRAAPQVQHRQPLRLGGRRRLDGHRLRRRRRRRQLKLLENGRQLLLRRRRLVALQADRHLLRVVRVRGHADARHLLVLDHAVLADRRARGHRVLHRRVDGRSVQDLAGGLVLEHPDGVERRDLRGKHVAGGLQAVEVVSAAGGGHLRVVLDELEEALVGAVQDVVHQALRVDRQRGRLDRLVLHVQEELDVVLLHPVPRRREGARLLARELRHDTLEEGVAELGLDLVQLRLQVRHRTLRAVNLVPAGTQVLAQERREQLHLLADQRVLLLLQREDLAARHGRARSHHHRAAAAAAAASAHRHHLRRRGRGRGRSRAERDALLRGVSLGGAVEERLGVALRAEAGRGLLREGEEQRTLRAAGAEAVRGAEVSLHLAHSEAAGHLAADHLRDEAVGDLAQTLRLQRRRELLKRLLLRLVRLEGRELLAQVAEDLVLHRRLAAHELLDRLVQRHLTQRLLQLRRHQDVQDVLRRHRRVRDGAGRRSGHGRGGDGGRRGGHRRGSSGRGGGRRRSRLGRGGRAAVGGVVQLVPLLDDVEDGAAERRGVVVLLVLGLEGAAGHGGQRRLGSDLDETLDAVLAEDDVLRLDPAHRRGELVREKLDEQRVAEQLLLAGVHGLLPVAQHLRDLGRVGRLVHQLHELLRDVERLRHQVRDVPVLERLHVHPVHRQLLLQQRPERRHARQEEVRVERHVDARKGDRREAALRHGAAAVQLLLLLAGLVALRHDLAELLLDLVLGHRLQEPGDVHLLDLQVVEHVRQAVQRGQLARRHVLLADDVVVHDLDHLARELLDRVHHELQRLLVERLSNPARVHGDHAVVGAALDVPRHGDLHRHATVEDDVHQRLDRQHLREGSQRRVLAERVSGEGGVLLHETLLLHVLVRGHLHQRQRRLRELRGVQQTLRVHERVRRRLLRDAREEGQRLHRAVGLHHLVHEALVVLSHALSVLASEVDRHLLRVLAHNLEDREAVAALQVVVGAVPQLLRHGGAGVQLHAHAHRLRALAGEDVRRRRLLDLGHTLDDGRAVLRRHVHVDQLLALRHADVRERRSQHVARHHHADEVDAVQPDAVRVVLGGERLHDAAHGSRAPHAVDDGGGEAGQVCEVRVGVDGVGVAGDDRVRHVVLRALGRRVEDLVRDLEHAGLVEQTLVLDRGRVPLQEGCHRVVGDVLALEQDLSDLDVLLRRQLRRHRARHLDVREAATLLELPRRLRVERQLAALVHQVLLRPLDPLLGLRHLGGRRVLQLHQVRQVRLAGEGVAPVATGAAVQELRGDLDHLLALLRDDALDLHHLVAGRVVADSRHLAERRQLVALLQHETRLQHAERVAEVHQRQQVAVDVLGEQRADHGLPAHDHREVQWGLHDLAGGDVVLVLVADDAAELDDLLALDTGGVRRVAQLLQVPRHARVLERLLRDGVAEPQLRVELLDAVGAALLHLADRHRAELRLVQVVHLQRQRLCVVLREGAQHQLHELARARDRHRRRRGPVREHLHRHRTALGVEGHGDRLSGAGAEDVADAVVHPQRVLALAAHDGLAAQQRLQPRGVAARDLLEPVVRGRQVLLVRGRRDGVAGLRVSARRRDAVGERHVLRQRSAEVLDLRRRAAALQQAVDLALVDASEDVGDRLVHLGAVAGGNGAVQDVDTAGVLAHDVLQAL